MLVALYDTGRRNSFGNVYWHCKCNCGNEVDVLTTSLISGNTKSCGCYAKKLVHQTQFKDLTNQKFGKLTVKGIHHKKGKIYYWECMCDCGNTTIVDGGSLRSGHTKSCGNYRKHRLFSCEKELNNLCEDFYPIKSFIESLGVYEDEYII